MPGKSLRKDQFNDLLMGRKDPREVVSWQLVDAFEILREGYFLVERLLREEKQGSQFDRLRTVLWLARPVAHEVAADA